MTGHEDGIGGHWWHCSLWGAVSAGGWDGMILSGTISEMVFSRSVIKVFDTKPTERSTELLPLCSSHPGTEVKWKPWPQCLKSDPKRPT